MSTDTTPWHTIPQLITDGCERFADLDAMVDGDERWNFREYGERARAAGRAFMASAMDQGDVYAIWAPNVCEWAVAALGGYLSASVLVPINTRFKGREAAFVRDGKVNLAAFWRHTERPWARSEAGDLWVFGANARERADALLSLQAPDFALPDLAGNMHALSGQRGKKIFLVTWASW